MMVAIKQFSRGVDQPWYVVVNDNGRIGARKFATRAEADACVLGVRSGRQAASMTPSAKSLLPEFTVYAKHYLEKYGKALCKQNTWRSYQRTIQSHIAPAWQGKRLNEIQRADVVNLVLKKSSEGLAPLTIRYIKAVISSIFSFACEEGILYTNPAVKLGKFIQKTDKKEKISFLAKDDVSRFLELTRKDFPEYYSLMLCAFRTGMRLGELLALAWEDIDFERNVVEVRRSYSGGYFSTPKSRKVRFVDMSEQLKEVLQEHHKSLLNKFKNLLPECNVEYNERSHEVVHLVFPNKCGKPIDGANLKHRVFYKIIQKAGLVHFRFHDVRHTYASLLLQQGAPLHYVKEQMGHASIQTTVDIYGHIVPGLNRNAVNSLDDTAVGE